MGQIGTRESHSILVVDDELFVRQMIVDILVDAGYATIEASCAGEALDVFRCHPEIAAEICAVVTDIEMPGELDGIALAMRLQEAWPRIGVVVTSGGHRKGFCALDGSAVFVAKPFSPECLIAAVHSVMASSHGGLRRYAV